MKNYQLKYALIIKLIAVIIFLSPIDYTFADDETWTGSTSTDWNLDSNWKDSSVPEEGDKATIPTGLTTYPIIASGTINVKDIKIDGTGSLTIKGGMLIITGKIQFQNNTSLHGMVIQSGGTLNVKNLRFRGAGTFTQNENDGVSLLTISKNYINNSGGTFISSAGTVQFTGSANNRADFSTGTNQFYNVIIDAGVNPRFDNSGGAVISVAGNFENNNSSLDVRRSEFSFNGTGDQTIFSASTPVPANTTFGDLIVSKPSGTLLLLSDLSVDDTYSDPGEILDTGGNEFWVAGAPLPVELAYFSAVILESEVRLSWRTITEVNNYGFEVERTTPLPPPYQGGGGEAGGGWEMIGFVAGHGNSNSPKEYVFNDASVIFSGNYYYRLKQINNDGSYEYSKMIKVDFASPINFVLRQNYPNPFNPSTTISFSLPTSNNVSLKVYNALGEEITTLVDSFLEAGVHTYIFNADGLTSGFYVYQLSTSEATQTHKMLYLK